ncbi:MAG: hypothetical protein WBV78_13785 [Roseobacter sp.]
MGDNAGGERQGSCEFRQSDVTVLRNQFFKKPLVRCKLAMTLNPSSIYALKRAHSSDDMKHLPNQDESQIKPNGNPTIQVSSSPL